MSVYDDDDFVDLTDEEADPDPWRHDVWCDVCDINTTLYDCECLSDEPDWDAIIDEIDNPSFAD